MGRRARTMRTSAPLAEGVPLFAESGLSCVPAVHGNERLVGVLTQAELTPALYQGATDERRQRSVA